MLNIKVYGVNRTELREALKKKIVAAVQASGIGGGVAVMTFVDSVVEQCDYERSLMPYIEIQGLDPKMMRLIGGQLVTSNVRMDIVYIVAQGFHARCTYTGPGATGL
jgi:hypothetical protein